MQLQWTCYAIVCLESSRFSLIHTPICEGMCLGRVLETKGHENAVTPPSKSSLTKACGYGLYEQCTFELLRIYMQHGLVARWHDSHCIVCRGRLQGVGGTPGPSDHVRVLQQLRRICGALASTQRSHIEECHDAYS